MGDIARRLNSFVETDKRIREFCDTPYTLTIGDVSVFCWQYLFEFYLGLYVSMYGTQPDTSYSLKWIIAKTDLDYKVICNKVRENNRRFPMQDNENLPSQEFKFLDRRLYG